MKNILIAGTVLFCLCASATAGPAASPRDVPPGFWAAGSVHRVITRGLMSPAADGRFHGDRPVTRYELAVVLDRLVRDMEAARRPLSAAPSSPVALPRRVPAAPAAALKHLVGDGFLPPSSPLLAQPGTAPVTADELADALARVTLRLSDRSLPPQKD